MNLCNAICDPGEKFGGFYPELLEVIPIQGFLREHMKMIQIFQHRV